MARIMQLSIHCLARLLRNSAPGVPTGAFSKTSSNLSACSYVSNGSPKNPKIMDASITLYEGTVLRARKDHPPCLCASFNIDDLLAIAPRKRVLTPTAICKGVGLRGLLRAAQRDDLAILASALK